MMASAPFSVEDMSGLSTGLGLLRADDARRLPILNPQTIFAISEELDGSMRLRDDHMYMKRFIPVPAGDRRALLRFRRETSG
jgi:hypothetical protein